METANRIETNEQERKQKEAIKLAHDNEERDIGNVFMDGDYTRAYEMARESNLLTGDEKKVWAKDIESASKEDPEKDPFKTSDPEYADKVFESAMLGTLDESKTRPLPNKLSRTDYNIAIGIAKLANNPERKYITDLTQSVINEAVGRIKGDAYMYLGSEAKAIEDAESAKRFILKTISEAKTDEEKLELLDQTNKNFILPLALQGKVLYEKNPKINNSSPADIGYYTGKQTNVIPGKPTSNSKPLWE